MWPPEWFLSYHGSREAGVLEDVMLRDNLAPRLIVIVANYLGKSRKGVVVLEDDTQLEMLFYKLKENIGKPLSEIGHVEIDFISSPVFKRQKRVRYHYDCHHNV